MFKQKTAYEMRISDWSSDVCSSDLGVHRRCNVLPVEAGRAAADVGKALGVRADDLGRDDELVPIAAGLHPVADDLLGAAVGFRRGRDRIPLGGVDEVHALLDRAVYLRTHFVLAVLHAPRHATEPEPADPPVVAPQPEVLNYPCLSPPF